MKCPYCLDEVIEGAEQALACEACGTPHHRECYGENQGCTVFGCKLAPGDDPKVVVTAAELPAAGMSQGGAAPLPAASAHTGFGDVEAPQFPFFAPPVTQAASTPPPPGMLPPPAANASNAAAAAAEEEEYSITGSLLFRDENPAAPKPKRRLNYIMLGLLLGAMGAHNFYAGFYKTAIVQLLITAGTVFYATPLTVIWAIVEVCTVNRDARFVPFE